MKLKEAIQLLANACRCTVSQSRWGEIQIKSNYIPELSINSDDGDRMSNLANVLKPGQKVEFARLDRDYTTVDGSMFLRIEQGCQGDPLGLYQIERQIPQESSLTLSKLPSQWII